MILLKDQAAEQGQLMLALAEKLTAPDAPTSSKSIQSTAAVLNTLRLGQRHGLPLGTTAAQLDGDVGMVQWRQEATLRAMGTVATLDADTRGAPLGDAFGDLTGGTPSTAPFLNVAVCRLSADAADARICELLRGSAPEGTDEAAGGGWAGSAPQAPGRTAGPAYLHGGLHTALYYALLAKHQQGLVITSPAELEALGLATTRIAAAADGKKAEGLGVYGTTYGVEGAFTYRILEVWGEVIKDMCGYEDFRPTPRRRHTTPPFTRNYKDAFDFVLMAFLCGGYAITRYTDGWRAVYLSGHGEASPWGACPPRSGVAVSPGLKRARDDGGPAVAGAGAAYPPLTYPTGYTAPNILARFVPVDPRSEVVIASRGHCWECGKVKSACPAWQACHARGGLKVYPLQGALSYDAAYKVTAAAVAASGRK